MIDGKFKTERYALLSGINSKASPYVNGPQEMRDLVNLNFREPGALTKRPGTAIYTGATVLGKITGGIEFERLSGASYLVITANTNAYTATQGSFTAVKTGLLNNAIFDFVTFVDRLFGCNGQDFFKFDGTNTQPFSLPAGIGPLSATAVIGGSLLAGVTGIFSIGYGYVNDRGYFGPASDGVTIILNGVTFNSIAYLGMTFLSNYGASYVALYRTSAGGIELTGTTQVIASDIISGATIIDPGFPLSDRIATGALHFTLVPRYLEIYNNQLFMGGFSSLLSSVVWSEIGEPENVQPEYFTEFRTNDGDKVTGIRAYSGSVVVTKERSMHRMSGDDPSNFIQQEITDQYGCLSDRAIVVFEDRFWCLDSKGIAEYDGAGVRIVSNQVEDTFKSMNVSAARENACALHVREDNEVWFAIPCDGSQINNCIVVYDYFAKAWTTYKGVEASHMLLARGALDRKTPFYGGYTGAIYSFGSTHYGDAGKAVTCIMTPPFVAPEGQTTEQMYRRFYLNVAPVLGITQAMTVNLRTNYGATIQATRTMYQNPFQSRVDFGLPGKSIQAEVIHASASLPLTITGYAYESRHQRDV